MRNFSLKRLGAATMLRLLAAIMIVGATCSELRADDYEKSMAKRSQRYVAEAKKEAKRQAKEFRKEGWKNLGILSMETELEDYYLQLVKYGGDCITYDQMVRNTRDERSGYKKARADVYERFASEIATSVKGKVSNKEDGVGDSEENIFIDGFVMKTVAALQGELHQAFAVSKRLSNGKFDVHVYFIANKDAVRRACQKVLRQTLDNQELINQISHEIDDYINDHD